MNKFTYYFFIILFFLSVATPSGFTQTGCTSNTGVSFGAIGFINTVGVALGDNEIVGNSRVIMGPNGDYTIYGALLIESGSTLVMESGSQLTVYGDIINNGEMNLANGATINFYGSTWTNSATAQVIEPNGTDGNPGADVQFIAPRPDIPANFITSVPCLTSYSGGDASQTIDGGDVPMDINLSVQNANNIELANTPTRIEGLVSFEVADGHIILNDQDFIFTANGTYSHTAPIDQAYFVTNDVTDGMTGKVEKEALSGTFLFPIGIAENDYTPATVMGTGDFQVKVMQYSDAAPNHITISLPEEGMDRVWNITSSTATTADIDLQHNPVTNGTDYSDPTAFITQYQGGAIWDNVGDQSTFTGGSPSGSLHSRSATSIPATTTEQSWLTKSSDLNSPLPIKLEYFRGKTVDCNAILQWRSTSETNNSHFELLRSQDGINFSQVAIVQGNGTTNEPVNYQWIDNVSFGTFYYRLRQVDFDGTTETFDKTVEIKLDCEADEFVIYPNPTTKTNGVTVQGSAIKQVTVFDESGRLVYDNEYPTEQNSVLVPTNFASGIYMLVINQKQTYKVIVSK